MKKFIAAVLATTLIVPAAAYAQTDNRHGQAHSTQTSKDRHNPNNDHQDRSDQGNKTHPGMTEQHSERSGNSKSQPRTNSNRQAHSNTANSHQFGKGERFERSRAQNYRRVSHTENRRLAAPPRGQVWVRSGHDALLVSLANNTVTKIVTGIF